MGEILQRGNQEAADPLHRDRPVRVCVGLHRHRRSLEQPPGGWLGAICWGAKVQILPYPEDVQRIAQ